MLSEIGKNYQKIETVESGNLNEKEERNKQKAVKDVVKECQDFFIENAKKFIDDKDGVLKNMIIRFYSDADRLNKELTNVFRDDSAEEILKSWEGRKEVLKNRKNFIKFISTRSFATNQSERFDEEKRIHKNENNGEDQEEKEMIIKDLVDRAQDFFIESANKFLNDDKDVYLRNQIIKFYSDSERLFNEYSNVFRSVKIDEIETAWQRVTENLSSKEGFVDYVSTKNYAINQEERVIEENRINKLKE